MIRNVTRRVEGLEARAMETARGPIVFRIHLVHPEKGLTGVLLIEIRPDDNVRSRDAGRSGTGAGRLGAAPGRSSAVEGRRH
jgi:hypothetical protein